MTNSRTAVSVGGGEGKRAPGGWRASRSRRGAAPSTTKARDQPGALHARGVLRHSPRPCSPQPGSRTRGPPEWPPLRQCAAPAAAFFLQADEERGAQAGSAAGLANQAMGRREPGPMAEVGEKPCSSVTCWAAARALQASEGACRQLKAL